MGSPNPPQALACTHTGSYSLRPSACTHTGSYSLRPQLVHTPAPIALGLSLYTHRLLQPQTLSLYTGATKLPRLCLYVLCVSICSVYISGTTLPLPTVLRDRTVALELRMVPLASLAVRMRPQQQGNAYSALQLLVRANVQNEGP